MASDDPVERFLEMLAVERGAAANTLAAYRRDLEGAREVLGPLELSDEPALARLGEAWSDLAASSLARKCSALRQFYGFLVDQDSRKVVYRKTKDSPEEFTLLKEDISQMSAKEITPLYPDLTFRGGIYYPVNPGGSKLSPSAIYFGGYGINFTWVKNARLLLEAGYTKCASEASDNLKFQVIPFVLSGLYSLPFPFTGDDLGKKLRLVPKAGAGLAVVDFDDGEGSQYRGYDFTALAGAGIVYELSRKTLSAGVWMEYNLIYEKSSMMHGALLSAGLQFMF